MWQYLSSLLLVLWIVNSISPVDHSEGNPSLLFQYFGTFAKVRTWPNGLNLIEKKPTVILVHGYPTQAVLTADSTRSDECSPTTT